MTASESHSETNAVHPHDKSSLRQWLVVVSLALLSLVLGVMGFKHATYTAGERMDGWDDLYNSMRLFHMHLDHVLPPLPWELQIARFLAPLVLGVTLVKGFIYAAQRQRHAFVHWYQSGHVVICGLGQKGLHLAREYRRKGRWVVIIEKSRQNEFLSLCEREDIHYIIGDAGEPAVLKEARAADAGDIIVVTPDDETNLRIAGQLCRLAPHGGAKLPNCFVHLENIQLRETLQRHFEREKKQGCAVRFFDVYESEARRVLAELPLDGNGIGEDDKRTVHVVILGFGRMGRSLSLQAARMGHFANRRKLQISVVDRAPEAEGRFLFHYPVLTSEEKDPICTLRFKLGMAESIETRKMIAKWSADPDALLHVLICIDDNTRALEVALRLQETMIDMPDRSLWVRVKKLESLTGIFETEPAGAVAAPQNVRPRIQVFGMVEDTCSEVVFKSPKNEQVAQAIHKHFVQKRTKGSRRTPENDPALCDWDNLNDDLRSSNFQQADHMAIKMRAIGCEIVEASHAWPAVEKFSPTELDLLAELEHTRWNAERRLAGWRYGTPSDKTRRINENITEWESLHPSIKKYDYEAIEDIPVVLALADPPLKVVRRELAHATS